MKIVVKYTLLALVFLLIGVACGGWAFNHGATSKRNQSSQGGGTVQTRLQMTFTKPQNVNTSGKKVFLNASQNTDGNTAKMAKELFGNEKYTQINLSEYNIPQVGQGDGDYQKVFDQLKGAKVIVIGTPVYWSNMSGYLKTFMDHMNINSELKGADLYTIVQGADSDQSAAIQSTYGSLNRIARRFELNFVGVGSNNSDMKVLHNQLVGE